MSGLILRLRIRDIEFKSHDHNIYDYSIIIAFFLKRKLCQTYNHIYW